KQPQPSLPQTLILLHGTTPSSLNFLRSGNAWHLGMRHFSADINCPSHFSLISLAQERTTQGLMEQRQLHIESRECQLQVVNTSLPIGGRQTRLRKRGSYAGMH